ncbi:MAG: trypsin-like peptidase domain-containing protein [Alistipes sp.]|nr:trypsin-like peptidase domain-containing protein [Alistipes sp.]
MYNRVGQEVKVTDGLISSKTGYENDIVTYQISAPIQPGSSGGPLFNKNGNLIGLTNAGIPDAQNVGYAIKASYLKILVDMAPVPIKMPANNTISHLPLTQQIKKLSPYVVLITAE